MSGHGDQGIHVAVLGIKSLPAFAGADRVVEHLLESFSRDNQYTIYLIRDGKPVPTCTSNRHYVSVPALRGKHLRAPSYFLLCCLHYLVKGRYDVAHIHNSDFGIFCPLLKLRRRVRLVGTLHGDPSTRDKWSSLAKAFLRVSEWLFVRVCDTLTSVSAETVVAGRTVHYIPNGIDGRTLRQPDNGPSPCDEPRLQNGQYAMFACGRLDRTKGLHHLLSAYRQLQTNARLLVVGDFTHDTKYASTIEQMAASDKRVILYKRLLARETMLKMIEASALFVFPSEVEGMSMMLLEALSCKTLIVCSDISANVAVVGEDYPFLFRSQDVSALRAALEKAFVESTNSWNPAALLDRIRSRFSWVTIAIAYEQLYGGPPSHVVARRSGV